VHDKFCLLWTRDSICMPFSTTGILWMEIMHIFIFFLHFWNGLTKRWQDDVTDETRYVQIQCNTGTCSQTFPCAIWLWNTLPVDASYLLSPDCFKTHLSSFRFIWAPDYVMFSSSALHCFYPKLLFIVCCTAFCLFTHGSKSSRHRYRKMKMAVGQSRPRDVI